MKNAKKYKEPKPVHARFLDSRFVESAILGASGLIAITLGGFIVYAAGKTFNLNFLSTPFIEEGLMLFEFPLFFVIAALIKIVIGGKIIELCVKYISRMLRIKAIIIAPDKPLIIVKQDLEIKKVIIDPDKPIVIVEKKNQQK